MLRKIAFTGILAASIACLLVLLPPDQKPGTTKATPPDSVEQLAQCGGYRFGQPGRNVFRWLRARNEANRARMRGGRLPRLFPLFWNSVGGRAARSAGC